MLNVACFVQSRLTDADFVIFSNYCLIGTRRMSSLNVDTRALCRRDYLSFFGGLFFLGMVLGPLFSIAAVLIMYYKQICEGYEDAERFAVMRKVGLTDAEIRRSVNSQVLCAAADGGTAYAVCDADDSADFRGIWIA